MAKKTTKEEKQIELNDVPVIPITINAHLTFEPNRPKNWFSMGLETADISAEGKPLGCVTLTFGGGIEIADKHSGRTWSFNARDLWKAYQLAIAEHGEPAPWPKG
jgi:hypothetical protein